MSGHTTAQQTRYRAACALDRSLDAATAKRGIHTDKVRDTLAAWLDGAVTLRVKTARTYIHYLEGVS